MPSAFTRPSASWSLQPTAQLASSPLTLPMACLVVAALAFASVTLAWILRNPEVSGWDQVGYADELLQDLQAWHHGGLGGLRDSIFLTARHHPPGSRLLALPFGLAGFADLTTLRLLSFVSMSLATVLIGLTARRAAGTAAGLLAAAAFMPAPVTLFSAQEFMSETLLLPALGGLLWCLAREVEGVGRWGNAVLLGACLGAGALARLSFVPQVLPVLGCGVLLMLVDDRARLGRMALAGLVASLIAWPFYALNVGRYIGYARFALADWHTNEIRGDGLLGYPGNWLWFVGDWSFGPFLLLALAFGILSLGWVAWRARPGRSGVDPNLAGHGMSGHGRTGGGVVVLGTFWRWPPPALGIAGFALLLALPPVAGHFLATNHNPRFLLAALPGLAVAMAIGVQWSSWRGAVPVTAWLVAAQASMFGVLAIHPLPPPFAGMTSMLSRPSLACDWRPMASRFAGIMPRLLLIGQHDSFNEAQVSYAFHRVNQSLIVEGLRTSASWPKLSAQAAEAQYVLALSSADPSDTPYYHASFRQVPESATARLDIVPEVQMRKLAEAGGFTDVREVVAPGPGACRAWLLSR